MKAGIRLIIMLLAISLLIQSELSAQDSMKSQRITFEEAWTMTNTNSHVVKQVSYLRQEKDQAVGSARGLYFPKVGLTASYMAMSQDLTLDLTEIKGAIAPIYTALGSTAGLAKLESANWNHMIQKKQFGLLATTFQWPIFVGGKIAIANNVARIERKEADEVGLQKQGELLSELVERYFGLCLAKQAISVRSDVFRGMEKHLQDAEKMEKEGLIAKADVLHAHVYFSQASRELTKANRMAGILNQSLTNTLVLAEDTNIDPVSELFYLDSVPPISYYKSMAESQNPQLLQVMSKKLLSMQKIKAERADYFPEIALQGMYTLADKDLSIYTPKWVAGVGLRWTLFDGTARSRKVSAALLKSNQVDEIKLKAESDISTMVDKLYNELNMYKEQLDELESARTYAEEYVRVREKAFHEEMSNATEVVDASLALAQVRIERLQTMYGYDLTLAKLCQYSGIPEEFQNYRLRMDVKKESYKILEK